MTLRRGQSLVLFALCLLLLTLMVCMTLSIGSTAARRTDLNNVADAAVLSNAVATARTFNVSALLNRAMVAHYVSQSGIQAQMAYATRGASYMFNAGYHMRTYDLPASSGPITSIFQIETADTAAITSGGCAKRTAETRAASYELWHRAYSFFRWNSGGSANGGDEINSKCMASGDCTQAQSWITPQGVAQAEEEAAKQGHEVHEAIWDLAEIQRRTLTQLDNTVQNDRYAKAIALAAKVGGARQFDGKAESKDELAGATGSNLAMSATTLPDGTGYHTWRRPMGSAVLGSRPRRGEEGSALLLPTIPENLPPLLVSSLAIARAGLAASDLAGKFTVVLGPGDTSSDVSEDATTDTASMREEPLGGTPAIRLETGMRHLVGRYKDGTVATTYNDACAGTTRRTQSGAAISDPVTGLKMTLPYIETSIYSAAGLGSHVDSMHGITFVGGCHGQHEHYGALGDTLHQLDPDENLLPVDALGYVLPDEGPPNANAGAKGAHGAWGQPKLPIVVSSKSLSKDDPFNLTVGFRASKSSTSNGFDMDQPLDTQVAAAAGMAYYHRRGHLGEPPNVLNPFWHAALVPMEIDERSDRDPTQKSQVGQPAAMDSMLNTVSGYQGKTDALKAYNKLRTQIDGMEKAPARD